MKIESIANAIVDFARSRYEQESIPLHRPVFEGNERQYLVECIDSNFVSSVGARVTEFEDQIAAFCGAEYAVATVSGTAALHASLLVCGVERSTEVLSQALTFVATANAISYVGASPVFIDVDRDTLGMSPAALRTWLEANSEMRGDACVNINTGARISACVPMHTFGLPIRVEGIAAVCNEYGIPLIEDTAESLGSFVGSKHTGTFGAAATLSFNGNKIITTGGGGMVLTNDPALAKRARHLTTTAKRAHPYEFFHDETGYNYRLPNVNAALGVAQMETLPKILEIKVEIAQGYKALCDDLNIGHLEGLEGTTPNYWLNGIQLEDRGSRDALLKLTNEAAVMTRPIWRLMTDLPMYADCQHDGLKNSKWLVDRVINVPSSVPESEFYRLQP